MPVFCLFKRRLNAASSYVKHSWAREFGELGGVASLMAILDACIISYVLGSTKHARARARTRSPFSCLSDIFGPPLLIPYSHRQTRAGPWTRRKLHPGGGCQERCCLHEYRGTSDIPAPFFSGNICCCLVLALMPPPLFHLQFGLKKVVADHPGSVLTLVRTLGSEDRKVHIHCSLAVIKRPLSSALCCAFGVSLLTLCHPP